MRCFASAIFATSASPASPTATTAEIAMQRSPADPYAAPIRHRRQSRDRRPASRRRGSSRRRAPARACLCGAGRNVPAIGVEPTNDTALTSGASSIASTASLSPWTTLNTPSGRPASFSSSAISIARRIPLGGLQHERVTADQRDRKHPHRHHRREIERRDARADAERLAQRIAVDAGADILLNSPFSSCGMPTANSTTSRPRVTEPSHRATPCRALR